MLVSYTVDLAGYLGVARCGPRSSAGLLQVSARNQRLDGTQVLFLGSEDLGPLIPFLVLRTQVCVLLSSALSLVAGGRWAPLLP